MKGSINFLKNFKGLRGVNPFQGHKIKKLKLFLSPHLIQLSSIRDKYQNVFFKDRNYFLN
jgi:hypothetical protein